MAHPDAVLEDPVTGQRIRFLKTSSETGGELVRVEVTFRPGGFMPKHIHPKIEERVEVKSGTLRMRIARSDRKLTAGDKLVLPPKTPHEARNETGEETIVILEVRPAMSMEAAMETIVRLSQQGKTTRKGIPKNPLLAAVIANDHLDETALAGIPLFVQRAVTAPLAAVGRALGYGAGSGRLGKPETGSSRS